MSGEVEGRREQDGRDAAALTDPSARLPPQIDDVMGPYDHPENTNFEERTFHRLKPGYLKFDCPDDPPPTYKFPDRK
jgi:hypothetical protein